MIRTGFLALVLSCTAACGTFQAELRPQFYEPRAATGAKIPLKVALVTDDAFKAQRLVAAGQAGANTYSIALNPGLANAITAELAGVFEEVSVVESRNRATAAAFVLVPTVDLRVGEPLKLALTFHDPQALPPVVTYDAAAPPDWHATQARETVSAVLAGLSVGVLIPVLLQQDIEARGKSYLEQIEMAIGKALGVIAAKIRDDQPRLVAHASGQRPGVAAARPPEPPGPSVSVSYPAEGTRLAQETIDIVGVASAPKGISRLDIFVNGRAVPATRDVRVQATEIKPHPFSAAVQLQPGHNLITVTAVDGDGRAAQAVRSVYREALQPTAGVPGAGRVGSAERWAVVIGIDQYRDPAVSSLRYATADAEAVFRFLTTRGGVKPGNARLLLNNQATQRAIREALGDFLRQKALKDDEVIIYYAGHGTTEPDQSAEGAIAKYLVPWDADPGKLFSSAIPMEEIDRVFGRVAARKVLLIQDTCFSGGAGGRTFLAKGLAVRSTNLTDRFLQDLSQKEGRMILTASDVNQVSQEDPALGHGIFTHFLLEALGGAADLDGDGAITVREVHLYLQRKVHERSNGAQTPQLYNIGDMVLLKK